jgi:hypothetical protein
LSQRQARVFIVIRNTTIPVNKEKSRQQRRNFRIVPFDRVKNLETARMPIVRFSAGLTDLVGRTALVCREEFAGAICRL